MLIAFKNFFLQFIRTHIIYFLLQQFISRSYCYTVWSAIGNILSSVCLSVSPSVCSL